VSVAVMTLVFRESASTLASRLVLLALADAAQDDGVTWVGQTVIAEMAKITEPSVRRCLRDLEASGEIEVRKAQRGKRRINVYRVTLDGVRDPDYDRFPFEVEPFSTADDIARSWGGDDRANGAGYDRTPSRARHQDPKEREPLEGPPVSPPALIERPTNRPKTVDRRPVTDDEYALAAAVLAAFNEATGSRYDSADWISKIVMRIRERPQLGVDQHALLIASALRRPWWEGPASPSVVYGNGALFERVLHEAAAPPADGGLTSDEVRSYMTEWGPGTAYETVEAWRARDPNVVDADYVEHADV
jgi:DNA-binding Lrp family transcriptional regulator